MANFHNPYNFIPTLPRHGLPEGLRDGRPPGHHRWHDDLWSGEIAVTMKVITPLLLMRERTEDRETSGHRHLEVATTPDNLVDIAPTQVKGMLRAAYEAVTCSRFGVFEQNEPLGYRTIAADARDLVPAIVIGPDRVVIPGKLEYDDPQRGRTITDPPVATVVDMWARNPGRTRNDRDFAHGERLEAVIERVQFSDRGLKRWEVVSLHKSGEFRGTLAGGHARVAGYLHAPGPSISTKRNERFFVVKVLDGNGALHMRKDTIIGDTHGKRLVDGLARLVGHQRNLHRPAAGDELWDGRRPWNYRGDEPGKTAWSRHMYELNGDRANGAPPYLGPDAALPPVPGRVVTCWAEQDHSGLRPVMVSRLLYAHAPADLLDASIHSASSYDTLSPADRLFGWVRQDRRDGVDSSPGAHRGQVRVVQVDAPHRNKAVEQLGQLTLSPLSNPKPSQGRFYLGKHREGREPAPMPPDVERKKFFDPKSQVLRGRKVFPHRRDLERAAAGSDAKALRNLFRYQPPMGREERDSQNVTLREWIRPGASFRFVIQVTDLHPLELGALLWLLDPARAGEPGEPARHRLGMGKPLGFGSLELSVDPERTRLSAGDHIRARLDELRSAPPEAADWSGLATEFEEAMSERFGSVLSDVRSALAGFDTDFPVHYPRLQPRSPSYEWFKGNEQGGKHPLPLLGDSRGLTTTPRGSRSGQQSNGRQSAQWSRGGRGAARSHGHDTRRRQGGPR
jgi:CRISPR-associated protein (TIGR03986 family)